MILRFATAAVAAVVATLGLVRGRSYVYRVRAVNAYGNSRNSDPVTVRAP